ncbi:YaiI/YqxD family protein [Morganella morganii]|uniref:YaiI/YqxD family protein n=1 Tax=Morganella TaxID=581 RepID=UPI001C48BFED|nr:YaiI/YqxD family protein [Morganella morganii]QXO71147.1 YaiI/YqxD family protein [Morganella morganii]
MAIWVDADACPKVIKEILYRAADREKTDVTFVANQRLVVPPSPFLKTLQVSAGFDVADNEIVRRVQADDLVVTADIPLAAEVLEKGAVALNPRGERYSPATIRERLTMRDFMDTMRASGIQTGGPAALNQRDRQLFANELDKWFLQRKKRAPSA